MGIKSALGIFADDKHSWRFKLANLLLGDDLRINLAFAKMRMEKALSFSGVKSDLGVALCQNNIRNALRDINELLEYPGVD